MPDLTADVAELQEDVGYEEILPPSKKHDLKRKPAETAYEWTKICEMKACMWFLFAVL